MTPDSEEPHGRGETLFAEACAALVAGGDGARQLFERAAAAAGPEMPWRIAEACVEEFEGRLAAEWMRRAVGSLGVPGGIEVHPGTLRIVVQDGDPACQAWEIEVRSSPEDRAAAVKALNAADLRVMRVTHDGRELSAAEMDAARDAGDNFYSPNYAAVESDPVPRIWLDCKDAVLPFMSRTVIRVVMEELESAGVRRALLGTDLPPT